MAGWIDPYPAAEKLDFQLDGFEHRQSERPSGISALWQPSHGHVSPTEQARRGHERRSGM